jgi:hypothetical protein
MTMSLTTSTAIGNTNTIGIAPQLSYPQTETYWGSRVQHNFSCTQVENGWILNYGSRHYVFENASDMIAKMNALLVESAMSK